MATGESDTAAALQDSKGSRTLSRAGRALRALRTDTVEGHGQMAYEKGTDPKSMESRGRSMRVKMPSWRMQEERESEEPARMRPSAAQGRFGSSALRRPEPGARVLRPVRRPATAQAAIERIKQERGEAAKEAEMDAALKAAALEAAELKAAELKEAARAAAAELKAAKEAEALRAARTLLVAEEAPTAKEARHTEQKKALAAALAEIDAALEQSTLLQTPRPSVSTLMETQTRAEGPAGQNAKYSSAHLIIMKRRAAPPLSGKEDEFKTFVKINRHWQRGKELTGILVPDSLDADTTVVTATVDEAVVEAALDAYVEAQMTSALRDLVPRIDGAKHQRIPIGAPEVYLAVHFSHRSAFFAMSLLVHSARLCILSSLAAAVSSHDGRQPCVVPLGSRPTAVGEFCVSPHPSVGGRAP